MNPPYLIQDWRTAEPRSRSPTLSLSMVLHFISRTNFCRKIVGAQASLWDVHGAFLGQLAEYSKPYKIAFYEAEKSETRLVRDVLCLGHDFLHRSARNALLLTHPIHGSPKEKLHRFDDQQSLQLRDLGVWQKSIKVHRWIDMCYHESIRCACDTLTECSGYAKITSTTRAVPAAAYYLGFIHSHIHLPCFPAA